MSGCDVLPPTQHPKMLKKTVCACLQGSQKEHPQLQHKTKAGLHKLGKGVPKILAGWKAGTTNSSTSFWTGAGRGRYVPNYEEGERGKGGEI